MLTRDPKYYSADESSGRWKNQVQQLAFGKAPPILLHDPVHELVG
jgi:hypothetical protein